MDERTRNDTSPSLSGSEPFLQLSAYFVDGDRHDDFMHTNITNFTKASRGGDMRKRAEKWPAIG